jgi:hypothetical protein
MIKELQSLIAGPYDDEEGEDEVVRSVCLIKAVDRSMAVKIAMDIEIANGNDQMSTDELYDWVQEKVRSVVFNNEEYAVIFNQSR